MAAGFSAGEGPRSLFPLFLSVQNSAHGRLAHLEGPGLALWDEVWTGQCPALKRSDLPGRYNWVLISPLSGWVNHSHFPEPQFPQKLGTVHRGCVVVGRLKSIQGAKSHTCCPAQSRWTAFSSFFSYRTFFLSSLSLFLPSPRVLEIAQT